MCRHWCPRINDYHRITVHLRYSLCAHRHTPTTHEKMVLQIFGTPYIRSMRFGRYFSAEKHIACTWLSTRQSSAPLGYAT